MKKIVEKIKKLKKPSKKYIKQEILKEIKNDADELLKKYFEKLDDVIAFAHGKYKIKTSDYKGKGWYVEAIITAEDDNFGHRYHLFIDKITGKNRYPRKEIDG